MIFNQQPPGYKAVLLPVGVLALAAGLYGRFRGLGTWPLGVDEYYLSRSVDNVLESGLPAFACGGFYTRGLLFQYLIAGARLAGLTPEFAGRVIAALTSLLVLPAAFRLATRLAGTLAGWLTVIILCVSMWEIEMARFGRMYAPFQAVFAWYCVWFLRYAVDRDERALKWLVGLSVLGVLTWEGGALLGVANLLAILLTHDGGRLKAAHFRRLGGMLALLVLLFLSTRDLRGYADAPGEVVQEAGAGGRWAVLSAWAADVRSHPLAAAALLVPWGLVIAATPWIRARRGRWLAAAGLCATVAAAALHQFTAAAGLLLLLGFSGLIAAPEWQEGGGRRFAGAVAAFLAAWAAFAHAAGHPLLATLFGFPDVYDEVMRPWGRTVPVLAVGIAVALAAWSWSILARVASAAARGAPAAVAPAAALLCLLVLMVLAVGATATDRLETRYTFFLYPVLVLLSVAALLQALRGVAVLRRLPPVAAAVLPLVCFGATEDFQPRHLAHVDAGAVNFRTGMSPALAAHYYPRNDVRGAADWLAGQTGPGDLVITGVPNLAQYAKRVDYVFLGEDDPRYDTYVCADGKTDRWSGHPVLYTSQALRPLVQSGRRVFLAVYVDTERQIGAAARAEGWSVQRVWSSPYGGSDVLLIESGAASAGPPPT